MSPHYYKKWGYSLIDGVNDRSDSVPQLMENQPRKSEGIADLANVTVDRGMGFKVPCLLSFDHE